MVFTFSGSFGAIGGGNTENQPIYLHPSQTLAVYANGSILIPASISASSAVFNIGHGVVDNAGLIENDGGPGGGVILYGGGTLTNSGTIIATSLYDWRTPIGAGLVKGGTILNSGTILGAVQLAGLGSTAYSGLFINTGYVYGRSFVYDAAGTANGALSFINYGTLMAGSNFQDVALILAGSGANQITLGGEVSGVDMNGDDSLTLLHGVDIGKVRAFGSADTLILAGTAESAADMVSMSGITDVTIAAAAPWVLEADAKLQNVTGFGAGDEIVLEGVSLIPPLALPGGGLLLHEAGYGFTTLSFPGTGLSGYYVSSGANGMTIALAGAGLADNAPSLMSSSAASIAGGFYSIGGETSGVSITGAGAVLQPGSMISGATGARGQNYIYHKIATLDVGPPLIVYAPGLPGGTGGAGVVMAQSTVLNAGVISGGAGGPGGADRNGSFASQGAGGAGVLVTGGVLDNFGTISGGVGAGGYADSVDFIGTAAATLVVEGTAVFNGLVEANADDTLILVNPGPAQIGEIGSLFQGFGTIVANGQTIVEQITGVVNHAVTLGSGAYADQLMIASTGFVNLGIGASYAGVSVLYASSTLINDGLIDGGPTADGVIISGGGMLRTSGQILGAAAVVFTGAGTLVIDPGAVFYGAVVADAGAGDVLVLDGTVNGTINLDSFQNFSTIDFAPGEPWTLIGSAAELESLTAITGLTLGDTIEISGFTPSSQTYVAGTGLVLSNGTSDVTLAVQGGLNGAGVGAAAPCFCAGTRIRTPMGEVAVEDLRAGDVVETAFAGPQRIKWIGRRGYEGRFIAGNHLALPVCIKAGAMAEGIPARDLWVSPDHAICEGGVLIHAWRLINGVSIFQADAVERVKYFHVELESHQVIFAENCPAESFLDLQCRQRFQNAGEFAAMFGDVTPGRACLPLVQSGFHLENIRRRLAARAGVAAIMPGPLRGVVDEAGPRLRGWAQDVLAPEEAVCLEVFVGGRFVGLVLANVFRADLRAAGLGSGCHAFEMVLPPGFAGGVEMRRAGDGARLVPAEVLAA